ncbi:MAG: V-type ATPase subunit subunit G family protein [Archaeoglobaceae archaeon]|nr:ATP synthase archaeal subunit H [Archaeoglobaceae archaeon]MDW7989415.1 V-type ATPase subunit subunit G family protein [Archaeoglobaceae archaeon]
MEKTEILKQIKEAEARIEEMIKNAEEQRKKAVANAKLEAKKILSDAEVESLKIKKETIDKFKALIEREKEEIKAKKIKEIAEFELKGKKNTEKAVELLYKEFVGMMGHA